jgi:hypothetical protein
MLYHMRKKHSLAGRRGKGGVRFRLILKRLRVLGLSPSGPARIPQCCQPNRSPTVLIPCALPGQTKSEL